MRGTGNVGLHSAGSSCKLLQGKLAYAWGWEMQRCSKLGDSHLELQLASTELSFFPSPLEDSFYEWILQNYSMVLTCLISAMWCRPVIDTAHSTVSLLNLPVTLPDGATHLSSAWRFPWQGFSLILLGQGMVQSPVLQGERLLEPTCFYLKSGNRLFFTLIMCKLWLILFFFCVQEQYYGE